MKINNINTTNLTFASSNKSKKSPAFGDSKFIFTKTAHTNNFKDTVNRYGSVLIAREGINSNSFIVLYSKGLAVIKCIGGDVNKKLAKKYAKEFTERLKAKKINVKVTFKKERFKKINDIIDGIKRRYDMKKRGFKYLWNKYKAT